MNANQIIPIAKESTRLKYKYDNLIIKPMENQDNKIYQRHLLQKRIQEHWDKYFTDQLINTSSAQGLPYEAKYLKPKYDGKEKINTSESYLRQSEETGEISTKRKPRGIFGRTIPKTSFPSFNEVLQQT